MWRCNLKVRLWGMARLFTLFWAVLKQKGTADVSSLAGAITSDTDNIPYSSRIRHLFPRLYKLMTGLSAGLWQ